MISAVELHLDAPGAYPMLLSRPWLRIANIKQHRQRNMILFRCGKTKVRVITEEHIHTTQARHHSIIRGGRSHARWTH